MKVLIKEKISLHKSKTPEGYLICRDAILARTGEQEYRACEIYPEEASNDTIVKVVRDAKEVFSEEAIASFENKPVTCEHPDEDVTPENYKEYAVGFVRDVRQGTVDGEPVLLGNLIITDSDIINDIENGIRTELSCGYTCDITSGDHPAQINIRGNHVALCEQGRAGVAKIVDSIPTLVKGLIFNSDHDIPAKSNLTLTPGMYKIGLDRYVFIFNSGTHQSKQAELEKQFAATNFEPFATDLIDGKIDTYDIKNLKHEDLIPTLLKAAEEHYGTHIIDTGLPKLPTRLKSKIQEFFREKSTFVHDPEYSATDFVDELASNFIVAGKPLQVTREDIKGWYKLPDGMMRKDYTFSLDDYDNSFILSLYADPTTYDTTEANVYFRDSATAKDTADVTYDTYRGYDIDLVEGQYEVNFNGTPERFANYPAALMYIDDMLEKTQSMIRDRAIRDKSYSPYFKRELKKEIARAKAEIEEEEAPDDDQTRLEFRKVKNSLLHRLKQTAKNARNG